MQNNNKNIQQISAEENKSYYNKNLRFVVRTDISVLLGIIGLFILIVLLPFIDFKEGPGATVLLEIYFIKLFCNLIYYHVNRIYVYKDKLIYKRFLLKDKVFYYKSDITDFKCCQFFSKKIKFYKVDPKTKRKKKLFTYYLKTKNTERLLHYLHSKGIKGDVFIPSDDDYYIP
ncbi:hypothetical protein [Anaerofustis butyriciformans]|uniref:hypothetical protein n=1 Tax=Anaerofustis butyriciformans TaxID=3108533 RepID=UPI003F8A0DE8